MKPGQWHPAFMPEMGSLVLTYFRIRNCILSSARLRFTVLFGMGRRGSRTLWAPDITCRPAGNGQGQSERSTWVVTALRVSRAPRNRPRRLALRGVRCGRVHSRQGYRVKPHGQLVPVSSTHYCASTSGLSTWWSSTTLQGGYPPGSLIFRRVSRLDAFSGYLFRT